MVTAQRKVNPVGLDILIDDLQVHIESLINLPGTYVIYARAYKNPEKLNPEKGLIPEIYTADKEYSEVFMDDNNTMTSFFIVSDDRQNENGIMTCTISMIVQVSNLKEMFPDIDHRPDEEVNQIFLNVLQSFPYENILPDMQTGIKRVYQEFLKDDVVLDDMSEFYVVRFNFTATYTKDGCCTDC